MPETVESVSDILNDLDRQSEKIDRIVENINLQLGRRAQLKKSLINECVTGEREVKNILSLRLIMKTNREKFNEIATYNNPKLLDEIAYRKENRDWLRRSNRIAAQVLMALETIVKLEKTLGIVVFERK